MNAAEDDRRSSRAPEPPEHVATPRVSRVNADPDHVSGRHAVRIEWLERLVGDQRIAESLRRGSGEHVKPSRRDHCRAERGIARIHEMDAHGGSSERAGDVLAESGEETG